MNHSIHEKNREKICNKELYEEVAKELKEPESVIRDVVKAQSDFTFDVMDRGDFENITYVYLGKVKAKLSKIQKLNEARGL